MLDFPRPTRPPVDVFQFTSACTVTNLQWVTWTKPRGITMMDIWCVGGGGGAGGGFTRTATNTGAGGSGGGSSGQTRVLIPALFLPDTLYIQVGAGGQGKLSGGGVAGAGILSYVATAPNTTASNVIAVSGAAGAGGGTTGTSAGQNGGAAGTVAVIGAMPLAGWGHFSSVAGQAGADDGVGGTTGQSIVLPTTSCVCLGGASGAGILSNGSGNAGGGYTPTANAFLSQMAPPGGPAGTHDGGSGPLLLSPWFSYGGCGGGSNDTGAGGWGGNGNFGAGGGGGGSGTTGGRGGDGGHGIVILTCW